MEVSTWICISHHNSAKCPSIQLGQVFRQQSLKSLPICSRHHTKRPAVRYSALSWWCGGQAYSFHTCHSGALQRGAVGHFIAPFVAWLLSTHPIHLAVLESYVQTKTPVVALYTPVVALFTPVPQAPLPNSLPSTSNSAGLFSSLSPLSISPLLFSSPLISL